MWWSSFSGRIELNLTKAQAAKGSHSGQCDTDIADLRKIPAINRQLAKINADILRKELTEYGAWEENELADHESNLNKILWIACGDIVEGLS